MKQIFLLAVVLGAGCWGLNAQTSWSATSLDGNTYRNGNVGIGVSSPTDGKLHIYRNATTGGWGSVTTSNAGLRIQDSGANLFIDGNSIYTDQNLNLGTITSSRVTIGTNNTERVRILDNGNVGIGTSEPTSKLEISAYSGIGLKTRGNILVVGNQLEDGNTLAILRAYYNTPSVNSYLLKIGVAGATDWEKFVVKSNGFVGINTANPTFELDVNGTIHTQEVKVDMNGWSDFVFHPSYTLRPLQEVHTYIQQNGHLPEIPTAKEVEENGISLGEMNAKLLQKIEELTLYTIEQEKRIKELEEQNKRMDKLEGIINELSNKF